MKIGILGAMDREVKFLYEKLEGAQVKEIGKVKYYCGTLCGKEVVVVQCGVGKVSAAVGAQNLINHFGIINYPLLMTYKIKYLFCDKNK